MKQVDSLHLELSTLYSIQLQAESDRVKKQQAGTLDQINLSSL